MLSSSFLILHEGQLRTQFSVHCEMIIQFFIGAIAGQQGTCAILDHSLRLLCTAPNYTTVSSIKTSVPVNPLNAGGQDQGQTSALSGLWPGLSWLVLHQQEHFACIHGLMGVEQGILGVFRVVLFREWFQSDGTKWNFCIACQTIRPKHIPFSDLQ